MSWEVNELVCRRVGVGETRVRSSRLSDWESSDTMLGIWEDMIGSWRMKVDEAMSKGDTMSWRAV